MFPLLLFQEAVRHGIVGMVGRYVMKIPSLSGFINFVLLLDHDLAFMQNEEFYISFFL